MTAPTERIERNFRRRLSFIQENRREKREALGLLDELDVDIADEKPKTRSSRYKSASVCLPMISTMPERSSTVSDFPRPTVHRCGGTSRFIVERNCQPESLDAFELQSIRLRGLSTSEVFHEPPAMYVYRERPAPIIYRARKTSDLQSCTAFIKKRKHTLCAWTFGIVAIALNDNHYSVAVQG
ncbi:hypothetical protein OSTOST_16461, partial [Ostertagia ostertagi]